VRRVEGLAEVGDTAPRRKVTSRGFVDLPVITRRRAGIVNGDRLLILANAQPGALLVLAPMALAVMLHHYTIGQEHQR
jgi:bifunctional DNA-binding transcriptional regulator/antitoxin component of YhaV-PrlF toxin-antitoxin module